MYLKSLLATTIGLALSIPATAGDFKRIKKKSEYLKMVADKKLVADWGWVIASSDGSLMGQINGQSAQGKWDWKGGYWCRTITFGSTSMPRDCQSIHVSGDNVVAIRDKGKGKQTPMKIK